MKTIEKTIRMASVFLIAVLLNAGLGFAGESRVMELAKLSIEDLISIKVTSVLKTPQSWSESPAAVYVLTGEDIRRSGAENITDLLRTVPGVQVAEFDENVFAVSIRGFNDIHANKLLVMVDGRSVYNHIFSGVFWNYLDVFMEDIDRIEVIRGPGSSVWGANAVNGVINIITKKAGDTKGAFVEFGGGKPDIVSGGVRYGGELWDNATFRLYSKGSESRMNYLNPGGYNSESDRSSGMGGFRADWNFSSSDSFSLQGEVIQASDNAESDDPRQSLKNIVHRARHLQGRWRHTFSEQSETAWQFYYQHEERVNDYQFDIIDMDFQHDFEWSGRHQAVWGLGYRFISDEMVKGLFGGYTYDPVERDQHLFSLFVQDTFQVTPDYLYLTLGSKFEHNDYTGYEVQPSIRISWMPYDRHTFWGAVSRAVRTPSRVDSDAATQAQAQPERQEPAGPGPSEIRGDEDFDSEDLFAYEIGYRMKPLDELWLDLAVFYNVYDHLATYEKRERDVWVIVNDMAGETYGIEVSADYRPVKWWQLSGEWSFLEIDMRLKHEQAADLTGYVENSNPRHQLSLHSALNIGKQVEFDVWLRYVDEIGHMRPAFGLTAPVNTASGYTEFDARLAWKPAENIELSVTGRNLGGAHQEFSKYEIEESVFFKVKIEFGK